MAFSFTAGHSRSGNLTAQRDHKVGGVQLFDLCCCSVGSRVVGALTVMFLDFSPLLDTMMAPHRQTKRPVHAQRRSSFDLGELPEHLQALVLGSPQLGLAELCAAASASKGLQALVQVGGRHVEGQQQTHRTQAVTVGYAQSAQRPIWVPTSCALPAGAACCQGLNHREGLPQACSAAGQFAFTAWAGLPARTQNRTSPCGQGHCSCCTAAVLVSACAACFL